MDIGCEICTNYDLCQYCFRTSDHFVAHHYIKYGINNENYYLKTLREILDAMRVAELHQAIALDYPDEAIKSKKKKDMVDYICSYHERQMNKRKKVPTYDEILLHTDRLQLKCKSTPLGDVFSIQVISSSKEPPAKKRKISSNEIIAIPHDEDDELDIAAPVVIAQQAPVEPVHKLMVMKLQSMRDACPSIIVAPGTNVTIGRDPSLSCVIKDGRISGKQCTIYCDSSNNMSIMDTSSNGTFVNNKRLIKQTMQPLHGNDVVSFIVGNEHVQAKEFPCYVVALE